MYQITAKGPRGPIETAWDALAWADPSPAGAVDAKEDTRGGWRLDAFAETLEEAEECAAIIEEAAPELTARIEEIVERDWVTMSLEGLPPVHAGPFVVAGSHALAKASPGKTSILIEAGPAFGTGHHGTTLGCLLALAEASRHRRPGRVLDLGTGSGVLAIGALKTGAELAYGTDIDRDSVFVARENGRKNRVSRFFVHHVRGANYPGLRRAGPYDTIFANILMKPLIGLAPEIERLSAPGAVIILSGLLHHQAGPVKAAFEGHGMLFQRRIKRDGWSSLVFRKAR
ncbi:50S ribosomal protein L11 methyltransferase [Hyphomonas sp.]|uniref:50S ribosomal protein L11 methyltransferase n=1 Tax=Hyphomonas sp. TaxID=87 RepID=UPI00391C2729